MGHDSWDTGHCRTSQHYHFSSYYSFSPIDFRLNKGGVYLWQQQ